MSNAVENRDRRLPRQRDGSRAFIDVKEILEWHPLSSAFRASGFLS